MNLKTILIVFPLTFLSVLLNTFAFPTVEVKHKLFIGSAVESKPLILEDGTIVIGAYDHYVYFIHPDFSITTKFKTDAAVISSATPLKNGHIAIGSNDGHVYILDNTGNLISKINAGSPKQVWGSPVELPNGRIAVGSLDHSVYVFDANGSNRKVFQTQGSILGSILRTKNNSLVVGSDDGNLYFFDPYLSNVQQWERTRFESEGVIHATPLQLQSGEIVALLSDPIGLYLFSSDGTLLSQIPLDRPAVSSPIQLKKNNLIVFGSVGGDLHFFHSDGTLKNSTILSDQVIYGSPAEMSDGTVVVTARDNYVYFVSSSGARLTSLKIGRERAGSFLDSTPTVLEDDTVVVGSNDGHVYFLKLNP